MSNNDIMCEFERLTSVHTVYCINSIHIESIHSKFSENTCTPPGGRGRRVSTQFLVFPISTRGDI